MDVSCSRVELPRSKVEGFAPEGSLTAEAIVTDLQGRIVEDVEVTFSYLEECDTIVSPFCSSAADVHPGHLWRSNGFILHFCIIPLFLFSLIFSVALL